VVTRFRPPACETPKGGAPKHIRGARSSTRSATSSTPAASGAPYPATFRPGGPATA